jgi:hypothetical protein
MYTDDTALLHPPRPETRRISDDTLGFSINAEQAPGNDVVREQWVLARL